MAELQWVTDARNKLTSLYVGCPVKYVPYHVAGNVDHPDCESGLITGFTINDNKVEVVFVRFGRKADSQGCNPDQLIKLAP